MRWEVEGCTDETLVMDEWKGHRLLGKLQTSAVAPLLLLSCKMATGQTEGLEARATDLGLFSHPNVGPGTAKIGLQGFSSASSLEDYYC